MFQIYQALGHVCYKHWLLYTSCKDHWCFNYHVIRKKTNMAAAQSGNSITKVLESICRERRRENLDKESEGKFKAWRPTWTFFKDGQSLNFANSIRAICQGNWRPGHMKVMCECGYDWSEVLLVNTALSLFAITWCFLLKMEREYVDFRMQKSELLAKFDWQFFEIIGQ